MKDPILQMRAIHKSFPGVRALDDVDLELLPGEVHILLGENGAGKSTLMKILCGAYSMDAGEIILDGESVSIQSPKHAQELGISIIYQEFNLIPHLTAAENIFLGNEPERYPGVVNRKLLLEKSKKLLADLGVTFDPRTPLHELSVANQQMVEVAKALSFDARILIMDEPTSALTDSEIKELFATIRRLKERGVAIVYISHRMEELFAIGDRVTVLRDGKYVGTRRIADVKTRDLVNMMVARDLNEYYPKEQAPVGEEILRVENLSNEKLRDVSLSVRCGEVVGLAGLLGAGRTELARALFGADRIHSGTILLKGKPIRPRSCGHAIRLGIGLLPEDRKRHGVVLGLSVRENIGLPNIKRLSPMGIVNGKAEKTLASRFVESLRIKTPHLEQKVMFLSGGNQQKVVLSKWLAREPELIIFDEPTRGVDVGAKVEIYQLINKLTAQGVGVIMISSELPEILGMSDRILVMHDGTITGEFSREEATQEKIINAALGQLDDD